LRRLFILAPRAIDGFAKYGIRSFVEPSAQKWCWIWLIHAAPDTGVFDMLKTYQSCIGQNSITGRPSVSTQHHSDVLSEWCWVNARTQAACGLL